MTCLSLAEAAVPSQDLVFTLMAYASIIQFRNDWYRLVLSLTKMQGCRFLLLLPLLPFPRVAVPAGWPSNCSSYKVWSYLWVRVTCCGGSSDLLAGSSSSLAYLCKDTLYLTTINLKQVYNFLRQRSPSSSHGQFSPWRDRTYTRPCPK